MADRRFPQDNLRKGSKVQYIVVALILALVGEKGYFYLQNRSKGAALAPAPQASSVSADSSPSFSEPSAPDSPVPVFSVGPPPTKAALEGEIRDLGESAPKVAATILIGKHGIEALKPLLDVALDTNVKPMQRYVAMLAAARLDAKTAFAAFTPLLSDRDAAIRCAMALTYGETASATDVVAIVPLLADPAGSVRLAAVNAIAQPRFRDAHVNLIHVLLDPRNQVPPWFDSIWTPALAAVNTTFAQGSVPTLLCSLKPNFASLPAAMREKVAFLKGCGP